MTNRYHKIGHTKYISLSLLFRNMDQYLAHIHEHSYPLNNNFLNRKAFSFFKNPRQKKKVHSQLIFFPKIILSCISINKNTSTTCFLYSYCITFVLVLRIILTKWLFSKKNSYNKPPGISMLSTWLCLWNNDY